MLSDVYQGILNQLHSQQVAPNQAEQQSQMQNQAQVQLGESLNSARTSQEQLLRGISLAKHVH